MIRRKGVIFIGIFIFIIAGILFLSAQLTGIEGISSQEFSYFGEDVELIDDNFVCKTGIEKCKIEIRKGDITTTIEATQGIKVSPLGEISVAESGAVFSINGNSFENIKSGGIILNQNTGEITGADFFTNENFGNYKINGNEFNVTANSGFVYGQKEFYLAEGTEILKAQNNIQVKSNGIVKYKGNDINGVLNFDESGNAFIKIEEKVAVSGVLIENTGNKLYGEEANFAVFFDKTSAINSGKTEYVIVDSSKNFFAFQEQTKPGPKLANRDIKIEFTKDNYFFGDLMDEKDYVIINEGDSTPGYLEITRASLENLPIVKNKGIGDVELWQDGSSFNFKENNIILSHLDSYEYPEGKIGTVPMILETPGIFNEEGEKIKKGGVIGFIAGEKDAPFKTFYFTDSEGNVKSLLAGGEYLQEGAFAEKEYIQKWEEVSQVKYRDMGEIIKQANNPEFVSSLKASRSADIFLTYIYNNKEIDLDKAISDRVGKEYIEFKNLQTQLEEEKIDQQEFARQIDFLEKETGKEPSISWEEFGKKYGEKNAQNVKNAIKTKTKSYYYAGEGGEQYLKRVLGTNELSNLNECIAKGGDFDNCFNKHYTHYGLLTELCGTNNEYCPVLTASKFFKIGF